MRLSSREPRFSSWTTGECRPLQGSGEVLLFVWVCAS